MDRRIKRHTFKETCIALAVCKDFLPPTKEASSLIETLQRTIYDAAQDEVLQKCHQILRIAELAGGVLDASVSSEITKSAREILDSRMG